MPGTSLALVIANDRYDDPALQRLRGPVRDAEALAATLEDPAIGGFAVRSLINQPAHLVSEEIEGFFSDRLRDDLLLLYVSCHGIKDDGGRLYFASTNTKLRRLAATGVSSVFVNEQMDQSRSKKIVLLLDCCYSGAFARGMVPRAAGSVDIQERFEGQGRAVITASTAMEYAFETDGEVVTGSGTPSLFTSAVLDGLRTGAADLDGDGRVSVDELYDYVFGHVREVTPDQTPSMISNVQGDLYLARSPGGAASRPAPRAGPAPEPGGPESDDVPVPRKGRAIPAWWSAAFGAAVLLIAVAGILSFVRRDPPVDSTPSAVESSSPNLSSPPMSSPPMSSPPVSPSAGASLTPGVLSQGVVRLDNPITGLDLSTGRTVEVFQSHLAWNGLASSLAVFDETTLGAVNLGEVSFGAVTPARLAALSYRRGAANPALSPADLPPGSVLAVRVAGRQYAKIKIDDYGPGSALDLRWVTYRFP